jgi:type II secretory pathway predicted ATPase ExeA
MYLEYWGLHRNPFDSVPDPGMYFRAHSTVESTVAELLFAIEEGNECLAVVVGEVGLGKTMSLRVVLNELSADRYRIAFVTNPDITFVQLMREIIGQLEGEPCTIRAKEALLEAFNRILFEAADSGQKVLIFIDEGNAMKGPSMEGLRLLTNMQEDTRNLLTIVIAGQPKLGRMLEDPRRANLFQRVGVYARLEPIGSTDLVRDYIEHRLERAGASGRIFDDDAVASIFERSGGVPRLVNRLCKLSLKAGETNQLGAIGPEVIEEIAARFEPASGRTRRSAEETERAAEAGPGVAEGKDESTLAAEPESRPRARPSREAAPAETSSSEDNGHGASPAPAARPYATFASPVSPATSARPQDEIFVPLEVIEALRNLADPDQRLRLAGQLAARQIQNHPEKYSEAATDPVKAWDELRTRILRKVSPFAL